MTEDVVWGLFMVQSLFSSGPRIRAREEAG